MPSGVVVGVHRPETAEPAVRWAAQEARLRGWPLTLVHAWNAPVDVAVDLETVDGAGLDVPAQSHAEHGRPAAVLLGHPAGLLVLGAHTGAPHLRHVTRLCVYGAACPVVLVPDGVVEDRGRVVVGVDGSAASGMALAWAAEAAALRGAELVAVRAWQVHPHSLRDAMHPAGAALLQEAAELARTHELVRTVLGGGAAVEVQAVHGAPLDVLLRCAGRADLLVVGRGSHHGLSRLVHGASGDDLSGLAPCPVAVVPGPATPGR